MTCRTAALLSLTFAIAVASPVANLSAQRPYDKYVRPVGFGGTDERSKAVQDLLKKMIEGELDRRSSPNNRQPEWLAPPKVDFNIRGDDILTVRRALTDFAREANKLMSSLAEDSKTVYGLREHYTQVLRIRAMATYIAQKAGSRTDLRTLAPEVAKLDQQWRLLAFQLSRVRGLSRTTIGHMRQMSADIKSLDKIFHIAPQIDRVELLRQTAALTTSLNNLQEDIGIELDDTRESRELTVDCRKIEQQVRYISSALVDRSEYRTLVSEYQRFEGMWDPFTTKVWKAQNRHLERSLRRIQSVDSRIRELLFLSSKANKRELLHLTAVLKRDVDSFFLRAPLKLLIELERKNEVLSTSDQFYGYCDHFNDVVTRGEATTEVEEAYGYIEEGWREFYAIFRPIKSQAAHHVLNQIEKSMQALKSELGLHTGGVDTRKALALAASVETLAAHIESDMKDWLNDERPFYAREAMQQARSFTRACGVLHRSLSMGAGGAVDSNDIRRMTDDVLDGWRRTYAYLVRCKTRDRDHMLRIAGKITPKIVDLRAVLGDKPVLGVSLRSRDRR